MKKNSRPKQWYRDFVTGKATFTYGRFAGWTRGGPLNAWYAVFRRQSSALLVPEYCLAAATRRSLPPKPDTSPVVEPESAAAPADEENSLPTA
jgi:hypothetical protein